MPTANAAPAKKAVAAASLALVATAACGNGAPKSVPPPPSTSTVAPVPTSAKLDPLGVHFLAKADAICTADAALIEKHPFPVQNFDVKHPKPSDLAIIGRYLQTYGRADQTLQRLKRLGEPSVGRQGWNELVALAETNNQEAATQRQADRRMDVAAFEKSANRIQTLSMEIDKLGLQLGFASDSACAKALG
jgi:hypothetical protein